MTFEKIQPEKLSDSVARQIEQSILHGILNPGDRLPSERDLAETFGVSRPSVRDAIAQLRKDGLLDARAGSGVFVADVLGSAFSPALLKLFQSHEQAVFDYLSFRIDLEGLAAERAANFASETDLKIIDNAFQDLANAQGSKSAKRDAELDAAFHMAICEASHNVVLLHMLRSMYDLLEQGVFYNRSNMFNHATNRDALLDQHRIINDAIQSRDGPAAKAAVAAHLQYVEQALKEQQKQDRDEKIARRKLRPTNP